MKNTNEILTYSGVFIDPFDPKPKQIRIGDIAHALSMLTRANGHISHFFSVAQHCLNCEKEAEARQYSQRVRLLCLLHDATESYLSDLTRPVKQHFPLYYEAEGTLQKVIFTELCGFFPTEEEWSQVGEVDDCMLYYEFLVLRDYVVLDYTPVMKADCTFEFVDFDTVRGRYIKKYYELSGR